jgi:hypothetical protein
MRTGRTPYALCVFHVGTRWSALIRKDKAVVSKGIDKLFCSRPRSLVQSSRHSFERRLHGSGSQEPLSSTTSSNAIELKLPTIVETAGEGLNAARTTKPVPLYSIDNPRKIWDVSPLVWPSVYFELGKGKLSALVTLSAAASYVVAIPAGMPLSLHTLAVAVTGTALSAMGASAFNQVRPPNPHRPALPSPSPRRPYSALPVR